MTQIFLTDDQLRIMQDATGPVVLCDQNGNLTGFVAIPSDVDELLEAHRRHKSQGPWLSTDEVRLKLRSLEQG